MALRASRLVCRQLRSLAVANGAPQRNLAQTDRRFSVNAPEDDIVKQTFMKQQNQFRDYLKELGSTKIPVDPQDSKAIKEYADSLKKIRSKVGVPSFTEKLTGLLDAAAEDSDSVRTFLQNARTIREELGVPDELGAEKLMFEALDAVESKIGKPLAGGDSKGMQLWGDAISSINSKLGISEGQLEKLEEEMELEMVKGDVELMKAEAEEKMGTYKRRDGLEDIKVDLKELDPRAYL